MKLFGKRDTSGEFLRVLALAGELSETYEIRTTRFYNFRQSGLDIWYELERESFYSIGFEFDTAGVRSGGIKPYEGDLPAGIKRSDSCEEVERKLGTKPEHSGWVRGCQSSSCDVKSRASSYWQHYTVPPYHFTIIFDSPEGGLHLLGMRLLSHEKAADKT